jgi:hypothetical protein
LCSYRSDGDATVDVGGAIEWIKADTVPLSKSKGTHLIRNNSTNDSRKVAASYVDTAQQDESTHFPRS